MLRLTACVLVISVAFNTHAMAAPERPLVVIPGILGSTLSKDGRIVWGDRWSLSRFSQLEIRDGPRDPDTALEPSGLIEDIQIFGPWKMKQYQALRATLNELKYESNVNYFEFAYDWRQSNFTSAQKFRDWVDSEPRLKGREFDIVAHSMGGLVAEIFVRRHDPTHQVRRLVTLGTPFLGSAIAVATPSYGWGTVANTLAGGLGDIRRTALSFPSIYELLPTYPLCCILGKPSEANRAPFNILAPEGWARVDWEIAAEFDGPERRERVARALARAVELSGLVQEPLPDHLRGSTYRVAGGRIKTRAQFFVDRATRKIVHWNNELGDGTVIVNSAAKGEVGFAPVSFAEHARVFDDEHIVDGLKRLLRPDLFGPRDFATPTPSVLTRDGVPVTPLAIELEAEPKVLRPGDAYEATLRVTIEAGQPAERLQPAIIAIEGESKTDLAVRPGPVENRFDGSTATFFASGVAGVVPGPFRISVSFPGRGNLVEDYVVILGPKPE